MRSARAGVVTACSALLLAAPLARPALAAGPCDVVPGGYNLIQGTEGANYLSGTDGNDVIRGFGGDDTIHARGGNDLICGGGGFDLIEGGPGNDQEYGEGNNDVFLTSPMTEYRQDLGGALLHDGATTKYSMDVPDLGANMIGDVNVRVWIEGPPEDLTIYTISPSGVRAKMVDMPEALSKGGVYGSNDSELRGTTFDSEAIINIQKAGSLSLDGRFHPAWSLDAKYRYSEAAGTWKIQIDDDSANGIRGRIFWWSLDVVYMTSATDGADRYDCGPGTQDLADYTARWGGVNVSLNDSSGDGESGENDNAVACEWVYSGRGNDSLYGNGVFNDMRGSAGNDTIIGYGGNDRFRGGIGNDFEDGGDGWDKLDGNDGDDTCKNGELYFSCENR